MAADDVGCGCSEGCGCFPLFGLFVFVAICYAIGWVLAITAAVAAVIVITAVVVTISYRAIRPDESTKTSELGLPPPNPFALPPGDPTTEDQ